MAGPVARKYSVLTEIVDIFTQACKVWIHDEDVAETDFEHTFETPKGFRSGFGKHGHKRGDYGTPVAMAKSFRRAANWLYTQGLS
jgi:hypothetical protein